MNKYDDDDDHDDGRDKRGERFVEAKRILNRVVSSIDRVLRAQRSRRRRRRRRRKVLSLLPCEHKKQTRGKVSKVNTFWNASEMLLFALIFFEFKRSTRTFLFRSAFCQDKARKEKNEEQKRRNHTSSYTFATSSSPSMSSNRFFPFVSFSCFSCSNFCFARSVLDAFRRDGRDDIFFLSLNS